MVQRVKRWLGFGSTPAVGAEFRDDGVYLAVVRSPGTVVGLGRVPLPPGVVVDGLVRGPEEAARLVEESLSSIHWRRPPPLRVAVTPETWSGVNQPGIVATTVHDRTTGRSDAGLDGVAVGTVAVAEPVLRSTLAAAESLPAALRCVEPSPVSVARALRIAHAGQPLRFARLIEPQRRWTLCDAIGSFEVDIRRQPGRAATLTAGADPGRMEPITWGAIPAAPPLRSRVPQPELFTPAIGAAFGEFSAGLTADVVGTGPGRTFGSGRSAGRPTMEATR